jgi:hypothetical protein
MMRIPADRSGRSADQLYYTAIEKIEENKPPHNKGGRSWPAKAVIATYHYLSHGVRILGEAYSTYDDRNVQ